MTDRFNNDYYSQPRRRSSSPCASFARQRCACRGPSDLYSGSFFSFCPPRFPCWLLPLL